MFSKKNKTNRSDNPRRKPVTQQPGTSQAFSYRSSRSRTEQATGRHEEIKRDVRDRRNWLVYLPSYIAVAVIIGSLGYASTLSSRPRVEIFGSDKTSIVRRDKVVYEQATADLMRKSVLNYSKLTLDANYISKQLTKQFPEVRVANIAIPLIDRQPVLRLELAAPVLAITSNGKQYALSEQGIAMIDITASHTRPNVSVPIIDDQSNIPVTVGSPTLTADTIRFVRTVVGELQAKGLKVQSLSLPKTPEELDVRLDGKVYYLKFNLLNDPRQQAGAYLSLKQKLDTDNTQVREYVDLRVDERAYYK